ncbi:NAD-dependent epimerase/dehydratase family protein [Saccharopolyspora indica]|uniref:NAD-dependent epimerase/dehydratase family protein n=1 Tax=Saccharopolyspora indica TaxID=1229659 RepID=UPI0022EB5F19|nr:NAD-dependent epimerase/dehydratase family protein [Saccharopolyspora indica]MDA3647014.1 NAD-dependent epimerase/dehydratase family protein [Saccharopolyspora indica]
MNDLDTAPAAVIGASGFLGSHLVRALTGAGIPVLRYTRQHPVLHDGSMDPMARAAPVYFYVATGVNPGVAAAAPERVVEDERAFAAFLAQLRSRPDRPTVVFTSSSTNYATATDPPYRENSPLAPESEYGAGKLRMERLLLAHADAVRPVIVRLASLYGPGHRTDPGHGVIAHWLTAAARGRALRVIGDGSIVRDFVHVADVVAAMLRIHRCPEVPDVLNIGSGVPVSLDRLLAEVVAVTGREPRIERSPGRGFDRAQLWVDISLASETLGWRPATDLATGLRQTWRALS